MAENEQVDEQEAIQVAINPQIALNTHNRVNTVYSGEIVKLEKGYAKIVLETSEAMIADNVGLIHSGFVFCAADYAAMAAVNEPNVVLASSNCLFLSPVRYGDVVEFEATEHQKEGRKRNVTVRGYVHEIKVFEGEFKTVITEKHVLKLDLLKNTQN